MSQLSGIFSAVKVKKNKRNKSQRGSIAVLELQLYLWFHNHIQNKEVFPHLVIKHLYSYFESTSMQRKLKQSCIKYEMRCKMLKEKWTSLMGDLNNFRIQSQLRKYYRGKKFVTLTFVIFIGTQDYNSLTFRFPAGEILEPA